MLLSRRERYVGLLCTALFVLALVHLNPWDSEVEATTEITSESVTNSPVDALLSQWPPARGHKWLNPEGRNLRLIILTTPKACDTPHIRLIQTNALRSWGQLKPRPTVLLFGDEPGVEDLAKDTGAVHVPNTTLSRHSPTPLLGSMFRRALELSSSPTQATQEEAFLFVNSDILLHQLVVRAVQSAFHHFGHDFFLVSRRLRMAVEREVDFAASGGEEWLPRLLRDCISSRRIDEVRGKRSCLIDQANAIDVFVFTRSMFVSGDLPEFAIGRPAYDNWLLANALRMGLAVVDMTNVAIVIHQNHDYHHLGANGADYWGAAEGQENRRLAQENGGWARGTVLHATWEFLAPDPSLSLRVNPRRSRRKNVPEEDGEFDEEEGDPPFEVALKRRQVLTGVFVVICGALSFTMLAMAMAREREREKERGKHGHGVRHPHLHGHLHGYKLMHESPVVL